MNIFKETWTLIKMMCKKVNQDNNDLIMYPMKHYPFKNYRYMMWCGYVIYRDDVDSKMDERAKNHETIHLFQAKDKKTWPKFYLSYFFNWFKALFSLCGWKTAYYTSKYEVEAFAKEYDMTYLERRTPKNVDKFKIKHRKSTFKKHITISGYKYYLRNLFQEI